MKYAIRMLRSRQPETCFALSNIHKKQVCGFALPLAGTQGRPAVKWKEISPHTDESLRALNCGLRGSMGPRFRFPGPLSKPDLEESSHCEMLLMIRETRLLFFARI